MKPLSIIKFVKGSLGKILPLAVTVSLSVGLMYFFLMITDQLIGNNQVFDVIPFSNMSILGGNHGTVSETEKESDLQKLKDNQDIKAWYFTNTWSIDYKTPSNTHAILLLLLPEQDILSVLKWQKLKLSEGVIPKNRMEILVHKNVAEKYGLSVGSVIKRETVGWHIGEDVKIVGIIDGAAIITLGVENISRIKEQNLSVLTLSDNEHMRAMNQFLDEQYGHKYDLMTLERANKEVAKTKKSIEGVMIFIGIIMVIALSVLLGNICMIQYAQRSHEFELLHALGYTRKYIAYKVLGEIGSSNVIGYFLGIISGIALGWLVNISLFNDASANMPLIQMKNMLLIFAIPLIVTISGMLAPLKMLKIRNMT